MSTTAFNFGKPYLEIKWAICTFSGTLRLLFKPVILSFEILFFVWTRYVMRCNGFKREKFWWAKQKCKEFLAFTSLEVRFLVAVAAAATTIFKSYKRQSDDDTVFLRPDPALSNTRHTHTYANNSDDGDRGSARAVRVVQLFFMADSRTERLRCTTASI